MRHIKRWVNKMKTRVLKPVVSEKSFQQAAQKKYTFLVSKSSNKNQIKDEIERVFKVKILSINTFNTIGKTKKTKGVVGARSSLKKAIVTVDDKSKIDLFEIEEEKSAKKDTKKSKKVKNSDAPKKSEVGTPTENVGKSKDVSVSIKKSK